MQAEIIANHMASTIEGILGIIVFSAFILSGLADLVFSTTWASFYFTSGLLVFSQYAPIEAHHTNIPSISDLNAKLNSFLMDCFTFKKLDTNRYGFRNKFFSFTPRSMVHGQVVFDTNNNRIIVKGYLDWFMIYFSLLWLLIVPLLWISKGNDIPGDVLPLWIGLVAFFGFLSGLFYLIDFLRLASISRISAGLWSRQYVMNAESAHHTVKEKNADNP